MSEARPPTSVYWMIVIPVLAVSLAFSVLACASPVWLPRLGLPSGSVTAVCAWARGGRVGLWWNTRVAPATALANAHKYSAVCAVTVWSSRLPERGRPALDLSP